MDERLINHPAGTEAAAASGAAGSFAETARSVKEDSAAMGSLPEDVRNLALSKAVEALLEHRDEIFRANARDLARGEAQGLAAPLLARLKFNEAKLADCVSGIRGLMGLADPLGRTLLSRQLDDELLLEQVTCPIGVIGVIFESRPDALVQISALCIKSGNCAILKGGSEAAETNRVLFDLVWQAGLTAGLPHGFLTLVTGRSEINEMLACHESVDLIIPRGSNEFVQYIMANSKIPVMGHADGICHVYVDEAADASKVIPIIVDSKTQYPAACNAVETLLVHRGFVSGQPGDTDQERLDAFLASVDAASPVPIEFRRAKSPEDSREYLDNILTVDLVSSLEEAIARINRFGSHHTDAILTEDVAAAETFLNLVDSAGVYHNCSTRFADGFRYGFGAEVGISTGKLHARGPVGLSGLVTYKYKLRGSGQIVDDYASGRKSFHFQDL